MPPNSIKGLKSLHLASSTVIFKRLLMLLRLD